MFPIRGSAARSAGDSYFSAAAREPGEDNVVWIARQLRDLRRRGQADTFVVLLGGTGIYDFRLRVAQSHLRHDMTPSHWSHAAVIAEPDYRSVGRSLLLESSLEPAEGFGLPSQYNGIQGALLSRYADPVAYPSVGLLRVPVERDRWRSPAGELGPILDQLARQRSAVDVPSLILDWLGFVWGAGEHGNPLLRGRGIPSAVVIESLLGAAGYDLCPGVDSAASCPETFWQTAKWWTKYLDALNVEPPTTRYHVPGDEDQSTGAGLLTWMAPSSPRGLQLPTRELTEQLFLDSD